jgi:hypothetical protein
MDIEYTKSTHRVCHYFVVDGREVIWERYFNGMSEDKDRVELWIGDRWVEVKDKMRDDFVEGFNRLFDQEN